LANADPPDSFHTGGGKTPSGSVSRKPAVWGHGVGTDTGQPKLFAEPWDNTQGEKKQGETTLTLEGDYEDGYTEVQNALCVLKDPASQT